MEQIRGGEPEAGDRTVRPYATAQKRCAGRQDAGARRELADRRALRPVGVWAVARSRRGACGRRTPRSDTRARPFHSLPRRSPTARLIPRPCRAPEPSSERTEAVHASPALLRSPCSCVGPPSVGPPSRPRACGRAGGASSVGPAAPEAPPVSAMLARSATPVRAFGPSALAGFPRRATAASRRSMVRRAPSRCDAVEAAASRG